MNIGSMLGFGGGNSGSNFEAGNIDITPWVTQKQIDNSSGLATDALGQQQAFVNALQGMGGLNNQVNAYNLQSALANQLATQNGVGNQSSVFGQQQGLANQLQGVANGTGPSVAQAQLAQATGDNISNQAALMAGQRGASSNIGMIARQAAQQGSSLQQQAIAQGAALRAQEQLAGMQALGGQQQNMANLAANQIAQQSGVNQGLAGQAATQVGQVQGGLNTLNQGTQSLNQNQMNAMGNYAYTTAGLQNNINNANAGIQGINAQGSQGLVGGLLGGLGSSLIPKLFAHGGEVQAEPKPIMGYFDGGEIPGDMPTSGAKSMTANFLKGWSGALGQSQPGSFMPNLTTGNSGSSTLQKGAMDLGQGLGDALARALAPKPTNAPTPIFTPQGPGQKMMMSGGGYVPTMDEGGAVNGKAKVAGDSTVNDTVTAKLSPGEIVIPRSIAQSPNAPQLAADFVAAILSRKSA